MNKIFFSWQTDIPQYRTFLNKCLRKALASLDDYELDSVSRAPRGAEDIAQRILERINDCGYFIGDISIVGEYPYTDTNGNERKRKTCNPNVLYETGYAMKRLGHERLILIAASETTLDTTDLPFDIRNRLAMLKSFSDSNVDAVAAEIRSILTANRQPLSANSPYIFCEPASWGPASNGTNMAFVFHNEESVNYLLEEVHFNGTSAAVHQNLIANGETRIHTANLAIPPLKTPVESMSFVVSRLGERFLITLPLQTSARADEQFNLDRIIPSPTIQRL